MNRTRITMALYLASLLFIGLLALSVAEVVITWQSQKVELVFYVFASAVFFSGSLIALVEMSIWMKLRREGK